MAHCASVAEEGDRKPADSSGVITVQALADSFLVWKPEEAIRLRECERLVPVPFGAYPPAPRQIHKSGMPCLLTADAARSLGEKGWIRTMDFLAQPPSTREVDAESKRRDDSYWEQTRFFHGQRTQEIQSHRDQIIRGKWPKILAGDASEESVIQEEIDKIGLLPRRHALVQHFIADPLCENRLKEEDPSKSTGPSKHPSQVFRDLHKRGVYITEGAKFGGDFLVYPGDPLRFHSSFVVGALERGASVRPVDLIAKARVAHSARKALVLAFPADSEEKDPDSTSTHFEVVRWSPLNDLLRRNNNY